MRNDTIPAAASFAGGEVTDWRLVIGSAVALTLSSGPLLLYTFAVFVKPLADHYGVERSAISLAPAISLFLYSFSAAASGKLFDRLGLRPVILAAILCTAAGLLALAWWTPTLAAFLVIYALITQVSIGYSPIPFAKAIAASFDRRRGLALGLAMSGVGIGTAVMPQLAQGVITSHDWRVSYSALAFLLVFVAFPVVYLTFPRHLGAFVGRVQAAVEGLTASQALRDDRFWKIALSFFLLAIATAGVMAHIVALLSDRGVSPAVSAASISVGGLALIAGRVTSGYLLDHIHARYVTLAFTCFALIGVILILIEGVLMTTLAGTALVGLALGAEIDLIAFLIGRYLGLREFTTIYGYLFGAFTLGTALGPLAMGISFSAAGSYAPALVGFALGLVVACCLIIFLGRYRYGTDGSLLPH